MQRWFTIILSLNSIYLNKKYCCFSPYLIHLLQQSTLFVNSMTKLFFSGKVPSYLLPVSFFLMLLFDVSCPTSYAQTLPTGMVLIPGGEFTMGKDSPHDVNFKPAHTVKIDSFFMDQYEVTNAEYHKFCTTTNHQLPEFWGMKEFKSGPDYPNYPVVGVSSFDAAKYAEWVGKRLPTEAEWEYAARGSLVNKNFPNGDQIDSTQANYGKKYKGVIVIGKGKPNAYELYDMAGNVWEWTSDFYSETYGSDSVQSNPTGPKSGRFRVIRGGSWHSGAMCNQVYYRNGLSPSWVDFAVGFRCVKNIRPKN